jgi:hypothetical protein
LSEKLRMVTTKDAAMSQLLVAKSSIRSLKIGIVCILTIVTLGLCQPGPAEAEQANACSANSAHEILAAVQVSQDIPRIQGVPSFDIAPIAGPMSLALRRTDNIQ